MPKREDTEEIKLYLPRELAGKLQLELSRRYDLGESIGRNELIREALVAYLEYESPDTLANQLHRLRGSVGQQMIAHKADVSVGTINKLETRPRSNPRLETLQALARVFEVTILVRPKSVTLFRGTNINHLRNQ